MAHFEELATPPEHPDNVTSAAETTSAILEDTMKLLAEAESRLESVESRRATGDNKLGEMIINTSCDNLDINLHVDDTCSDKSEFVSVVSLKYRPSSIKQKYPCLPYYLMSFVQITNAGTESST